MADSVPGLMKSLPEPQSRAESSPTMDKRPAALKNATNVRNIFNVGGSKRSPASGSFTSK